MTKEAFTTYIVIWKSHTDTVSYLYDRTSENVARMMKGKAPIGFDGFPIELHHIDGIGISDIIIPMSKPSHTILHKYIGYKNFVEYIIGM